MKYIMVILGIAALIVLYLVFRDKKEVIVPVSVDTPVYTQPVYDHDMKG